MGLAGDEYADDPLSPTQVESAVQILAGASKSYQSGNNAGIGGLDWQQVQTQLASVLTATQLATLSTLIQGQLASEDVARREKTALLAAMNAKK